MAPILASKWPLSGSTFSTFQIHTRPRQILKNWMVQWIKPGFPIRTIESCIPRGLCPPSHGGRWLSCFWAQPSFFWWRRKGLWTLSIAEFALVIRNNALDGAVHSAIPFNWWFITRDPEKPQLSFQELEKALALYCSRSASFSSVGPQLCY